MFARSFVSFVIYYSGCCLVSLFVGLIVRVCVLSFFFRAFVSSVGSLVMLFVGSFSRLFVCYIFCVFGRSCVSFVISWFVRSLVRLHVGLFVRLLVGSLDCSFVSLWLCFVVCSFAR